MEVGKIREAADLRRRLGQKQSETSRSKGGTGNSPQKSQEAARKERRSALPGKSCLSPSSAHNLPPSASGCPPSCPELSPAVILSASRSRVRRWIGGARATGFRRLGARGNSDTLHALRQREDK
ncbi:hypothetical protein AOLI_G00047240 [Acnodon oligacanthus]